MPAIAQWLRGERRAETVNLGHPKDPALAELFGAGLDTPAGVRVTLSLAMKVTTFNAAVRILSETMAALPNLVFENDDRRRSDGTVEARRYRAVDHPSYHKLRYAPNEEQTAYHWIETAMLQLVAASGNSYNRIELDQSGDLRQIVPLIQERTTPRRRNGRLWYEVKLPGSAGGGIEWLQPSEVIHVPALGFDGLVGWAPLDWLRRSIGFAVALEDYGATFFGDNARVEAVAQTDAELSQEAYDRLHADLRDRANADYHGLLLLEEGLKWEQIGTTPEQGQFLATRKFSVEDLARIFRIPLHMLANLERATFDNIEHQSLEFATYTMAAWLERWQQELTRKLFTRRDEVGRYFVEFNLAKLLLADIKARFEAHAIAINTGFANPDEARAAENWNPMPDGQGQTFRVPLNMVNARELLGQQPIEDDESDETRAEVRTATDYLRRNYLRRPGEPADPGERGRRAIVYLREERSLRLRRRLMRAHQAILEDATGRTIRRELNALRRFIRRHLERTPDVEAFRTAIEGFYADQPAQISRIMLPALVTYAEAIASEAVDEVGAEFSEDVRSEVEAFAGEYATAFGIREAASRRNQLLEMADELDPEDLVEELGGRLSDWEETGAQRTARRELIRGGAGAFAIAGWSAVGVTAMRWVTTGKNCPLCNQLDGKVIRSGQNFLDAGATVSGGGATPDLTTRRAIGHPPLHDACDCMLVAAT